MDRPPPPTPDASPLHDVALLALVVAHGTDGALHRHEVGALLDRLRELEPVLGGDAEASLQHAAGRYESVRVAGLDELALRLGRDLGEDARARTFAALVAVAEADGVVHPMEATVLRHLGQAWGVPAWPGEAATDYRAAAAPPA